jgi:hypothetical protein
MIAQFFGTNRTMAATACVGACLFGALLWLTWSISRHPAAFYADPLAVAAAEPPAAIDPEAPELTDAKTKPAEAAARPESPIVEKSAEPSAKPAPSDAARAAARKAAHAKASQQRAAERARARRNTFDQEAPRSAARPRGGDFISDFLNAFQ